MEQTEAQAAPAPETAAPAAQDDLTLPAPEAPAQAVAAGEVAQQPDPVSSSDIDKHNYDLLGDASPSWMQALDMVLEKNGGDTFKVDREAVDGLPIEAKQLLHNMRKKMLTTTQANADLRKKMETSISELNRLKQDATLERAQVYDIFKHPDIKAMTTPPEGEQPDVYSKEGQEWLARKNFAELFQKFTDGIERVAKENTVKVEEQRKAEQHTSRVQQIKDFAASKPDFAEHYEDIKKMVDEYGMPAEKAYRYVKLDKGLILDDVSAARLESQTASVRGGVGGRPLLKQRPNGEDARDLMDFYNSNPDAMKADLEKWRRQGVGY